jgi:integrase
MRIGAVPDLKIKHLTKIPQYSLYQVTVYEGLHEEYYSFTTPEAAKAIDTYLEYRVRQGEKISQDAPLFRQQFDVRDMDIVKNPKSMDKRVLADLIRQKIHRSGLMSITPLTAENKPGKKRNPIKRAHGFRKFVTTTMINAGVNETVVDKLTGHSTGNRRAYYKPQSVDLLGEFLKAVDALTINEENRLRMKVQQLTIDVSEIAQFKKELDDLKELVRRS